MTRYVAIANPPDPHAVVERAMVYPGPQVNERPAECTGILNAQGAMLYRLPNPIGFNR